MISFFRKKKNKGSLVGARFGVNSENNVCYYYIYYNRDTEEFTLEVEGKNAKKLQEYWKTLEVVATANKLTIFPKKSHPVPAVENESTPTPETDPWNILAGRLLLQGKVKEAMKIIDENL